MRILLAGETYPPDVNGAGVFTCRLAEGLARRRHEVHVIVPSPSCYSYEAQSDGVWLHYLPSHRYRWHPTFHILDLRKGRQAVTHAMRSVRPEVVHVQAHFAVGRFAAAQSTRLNIPLVATNHFMPENLKYQLPFNLPDLLYNRAAALAWRDLARVFRNANVITAPTPYAVDLLRKRARISDALAVSCGVDLAAYPQRTTKKGDNRQTILFVGRLDPEKHVDEIIDAVAMMDSRVYLRVVGVGRQEPNLRRQARVRGIDDRVTIVGYLPEEELLGEYARADVFCMPGTAELQSIATLEAMASGLPVVAASAKALPSLVTTNVNGALFPPGDVTALADALRYVLDGERVKRMGEASRLRVQQHDFSLTLDAYERIYRDAIQRQEPHYSWRGLPSKNQPD